MVADSVTGSGAAIALAQSPGRIDPASPVYNAGYTLTSPATTRTMASSASRKPLAAQFSWDGHTLFVINNHLDAKLEDDADFGRYQPPVLWSEIQRVQQTQLIWSPRPARCTSTPISPARPATTTRCWPIQRTAVTLPAR
jgi:hypothetical protein